MNVIDNELELRIKINKIFDIMYNCLKSRKYKFLDLLEIIRVKLFDKS